MRIIAVPGKNQNRIRRVTAHAVLVVFLLAVSVGNASAYTGPIPAAGEVGTVLGVLAGLLTLVVGAIWYPARRMIKSICTFFGKE